MRQRPQIDVQPALAPRGRRSSPGRRAPRPGPGSPPRTARASGAPDPPSPPGPSGQRHVGGLAPLRDLLRKKRPAPARRRRKKSKIGTTSASSRRNVEKTTARSPRIRTGWSVPRKRRGRGLSRTQPAETDPGQVRQMRGHGWTQAPPDPIHEGAVGGAAWCCPARLSDCRKSSSGQPYSAWGALPVPQRRSEKRGGSEKQGTGIALKNRETSRPQAGAQTGAGLPLQPAPLAVPVRTASWVVPDPDGRARNLVGFVGISRARR